MNQHTKYEVFETEQEAKKKLFLMDKNSIFFCPLINSKCRFDCVCYVKPYIIKISISVYYTYHLYEGYCANKMFTCGG